MADHFPTTASTDFAAGNILVAHPGSRLSGIFDRSVALITENFQGHITGLVLNKQLHITEADLLKQHGITPEPGRTAPVYCGGPVNSNNLILLHTSEWRSTNTMQINQHLSISSDTNMLSRMAIGRQPRQYRWIAGVSGWAPGQLAQEAYGHGRWQEPQWIKLETDVTQSVLWNTPHNVLWMRSVESYSKSIVDHWI